MNMLKELHLVSRIFYTFIATLALSSLAGIEINPAGLFMAGALIFLNSFMFEYYVLHFALKNVVKTPRGRIFFLLGWAVACIGGVVLSVIEVPSIKTAITYASVEDFKKSYFFWLGNFMVFSSAFVAFTCARRAFTRHGSLD
jgi:hypothetical protein